MKNIKKAEYAPLNSLVSKREITQKYWILTIWQGKQKCKILFLSTHAPIELYTTVFKLYTPSFDSSWGTLRVRRRVNITIVHGIVFFLRIFKIVSLKISIFLKLSKSRHATFDPKSSLFKAGSWYLYNQRIQYVSNFS